MANGLLDGKEMTQSWKINEILSLHKEKEDAKCCSRYRTVKLLEQGMKVVERIFEKQLRK